MLPLANFRKAVPALQQAWAASYTLRQASYTLRGLADSTQPKEKDDDDDTFELLPPGCSMLDPTYGLHESEPTASFYDPSKEDVRPKRPAGKRMPATPSSRAAAEELLKAKQKPVDEDEPYVYLPPGSSMREPGYNSTSDPEVGRQVYLRDPPPPTTPK